MTIQPVQIGRYYPGRSPVHELDPRTKLVILVLLATAAFRLNALPSLAFLALFGPLGHLAARIPQREVYRGLRKFLWLFAFTALVQFFWTPGRPVLTLPLGYWNPVVTIEGLYRGLVVFLRLFIVITGASLLSSTTSPGRLGAALERLLGPLSRIGLPVEEISLAFSIGMQFLPIIFDEAGEIRNAQISRGIGHLHRNPLVRLSSLRALLIPVMVRSVRRADGLADAMLVRGYREGSRRTSLHPLGLGWSDLAAFCFFLLFLSAGLLSSYVHLLQ